MYGPRRNSALDVAGKADEIHVRTSGEDAVESQTIDECLVVWRNHFQRLFTADSQYQVNELWFVNGAAQEPT